MGRSGFLSFHLLFALVLVLCTSYGFGRKVMTTVEFEDSSVLVEETGENLREMIEMMDYKLKPEPNINPRTPGYVYCPPPQGD